MSKLDSRTGRYTSSYKKRKWGETMRNMITSEQKRVKYERERKLNKQLGPKEIMRQLIEKGYPDEEAIKYIQNKFEAFQMEEELLKSWIKEIKQELAFKNKYRQIGAEDGR